MNDKENLPERIKLLMGKSSIRSFARECDIPESTLRGYLEGRRWPTYDNFQKIAKTGRATIEWVATGRYPQIDKIDKKLLISIYENDHEVIDIERKEVNLWPVVKTYDDEEEHLLFYCIHCRVWHAHGRGGKNAIHEKGRGGMAGHRNAHCVSKNSPFKISGVILDVVGKFADLEKKQKEETELLCPTCSQYYSAAFNTCECGYINKKSKSKYPLLEKIYRQSALIPDKKDLLEQPSLVNRLSSDIMTDSLQQQKVSSESNEDDDHWSMDEMLDMTKEVLESKTVYRSALASNVRAFHKAVTMEGEMNQVREEITAIRKENKEIKEGQVRMEELLKSLGASLPQKREATGG